jgi:hypothetical protein
MFSDAFAAFAQVPELFSRLAALGDSASLDSVREVLEDLGALDETNRAANPYELA